MSRLLPILVLILFACDDPVEDDSVAPTTAPAAVETGPSRADLVAMTDQRVDPQTLAEALGAPVVETRRFAAMALARLHNPDAVPLLRRALRDPDPEVRRHAALGLGGLEQDAPAEAERVLLAALAAEDVRENEAAYLWDLGRIAGEGALGAFREALAGDVPVLREAACRGLGGYGLRRRRLDPALLRRVATRARDDQQAPVRLACAYALGRLEAPPEGPERDGVRADLVAALEDPEAEVRALAVRALGAYPGAEAALAERTADADWQVAVQAYRSLGRTVAEDRGRGASQALRGSIDATLSDGALSETEAHVLLAGLVALAPAARFEPVFAVSREAYDRLGEPPSGRPLSRARGLAHCHAAALLDKGRGWPNAVEGCGLEQVEDDERRLLAVEVLTAGEGSDAQRGVFLRRLHGEGGARVKEAVLGAIPRVPDPELWGVVLGDLAVDDSGVVIAACDAVDALAAVWAETVGGDEPVLSIRAAGAPAPPPDTPHRRGPPLSRIHRGLDAAHQTLAAADDLEGLQSWIRAVRAIGDQGFAAELDALGAHENPTLRALAREGRNSDPRPETSPVSNAIAPSEVPEASPIRAVLTTSVGQIVIELDPASAPTTVARFVGLAEADFFDGLTFHRVVAAFVVQGGDPRGDGYGGPGWSQRCEDNRIRYERGTLGMALAGRDTGGSQFFITHGPQPHLEGRYTAFGRVVEGMDVVDRLLVGARIVNVQIADD